jgi:small-conductance mechanosensitive channel/CRP-like cAMP-binding protein
MASADIQRRTFYFFVTAAVIVVVLLLFPVIEDWALAAMAARMGMAITPDGTVTMLDGSAPAKMTETSITILLSVLHLVKIVVWMALVITVVRYVSFLVTKTLYRNAKQGEVSSLLRTVLSVIVYIVAFFIIFQSQFPTVQLAPLFTGSTIIGIVVGLALQDTLGNLFAGLALQADQPFQVGDVINLQNRGTGVVESVSWRGVKIRTFQNKLLVISNAILGKELIEVAPKGNLNARSVTFSTVYAASPANIAHRIREAVRLAENVSQKMRPVVRIRNLGENGVDWEIKYWLDDYTKYNDTDALLRERVWYALKREQVEFSFPTRTIYIDQRPIAEPADVVFNTIAERLNRVSIFAPLSDEEVEKLANSCTTRVYAPGEAIVRQGQEGNSMFVICKGSVKVQIPEKEYQKTINTLGENDFFGEMSLLTGEPRTANVIAVVESEVLRIDKVGLQPILEGNPALVETISELVEERRELLQQAALADAEEQTDNAGKGMLRSIRSFFGLGNK